MMTAKQVKDRLGEIQEEMWELSELLSFVDDSIECPPRERFDALLRERRALHTALKMYIREEVK